MLKSIIRMERGSTRGSGSPMWRCTTDDNEKVNAFAHQTPSKNTFRFFVDAGYGDDMLGMVETQVMEWKNHPILVNLERTSDGKWWDIISVIARAPDAIPDPDYKPDLDAMRQYAIRHALVLMEHPIRVLDFETTGTGPDDEIVQIGLIDGHGNNLMNRFIMPEHPERLLLGEKSAASLTGITPELLRDEAAPTFPEVYEKLRTLLEGQIWIIYNAKFDAPMLDQVCLRHKLPPIPAGGIHCAMELAAAWYGQWNYTYRRFDSHPLSELAAACGIPAAHAHHALADVVMTCQLIRYIGEGRPVPVLQPSPSLLGGEG